MGIVREWVARVGRRNIAYLAFVSLLVPFAAMIEAASPQGPGASAGIMAAVTLWSVVSLIFFVANAAAAAARLMRGQPAAKPLIACALPLLCIGVPLLLGPFFVR